MIYRIIYCGVTGLPIGYIGPNGQRRWSWHNGRRH